MPNELQQLPLFLDRQEQLKFRDLMNLMEYPFFSISKQPVRETRIYDDGKVRIEVKPGAAGLATIWDKDILIYVASQINRMINEGQPISQKVRFHAHDFFASCGRSSGGRAYEALVAAFDRLQSTSIRTNIADGKGERELTFFSWIKSGKMKVRDVNGKQVLGMCEVEVEDWIWSQIVEDRSILAIDSNYFGITSGFARRIYELARKHCGRSTSWTINLPRLAEKTGYGSDDLRNFKRFLGEVVEANDLPEYEIHVALAGDPTATPIENISSVRGIRSLKAVLTRRANVLDRRAVIEDRRTTGNVLETRAASRTDVLETRAAGESEDAQPVEMATSQDFQQLIERMTGNLKA